MFIFHSWPFIFDPAHGTAKREEFSLLTPERSKQEKCLGICFLSNTYPMVNPNPSTFLTGE